MTKQSGSSRSSLGSAGAQPFRHSPVSALVWLHSMQASVRKDPGHVGPSGISGDKITKKRLSMMSFQIKVESNCNLKVGRVLKGTASCQSSAFWGQRDGHRLGELSMLTKTQTLAESPS